MFLFGGKIIICKHKNLKNDFDDCNNQNDSFVRKNISLLKEADMLEENLEVISIF
jgi:hypothetical protein